MCMCVKPSQSSQAHMSILDLHVHVCLCIYTAIYTALLKWGVSTVTPPPLLAKLIADFHECRAGLCMCVRPSGVWAYCQNTCERERKEEKKSAAVPIGPKGTSLQAGDPESQLWSQLSNLSVRDIFLKPLLSAPST